jgi:hypothetical protein
LRHQAFEFVNVIGHLFDSHRFEEGEAERSPCEGGDQSVSGLLLAHLLLGHCKFVFG